MDFDPAAFGHRVRAARVWKDIAPKELAARIGRSDEAIYRLERGEHRGRPDKLLLAALAKELDQTEEWLLAGATPPWMGSATPIEADVLERARQVAVRLADDLEELAELLEADDEAATG